MSKKLYILGREFLSQINKNHVSAYASSAAFFMFLSLIPILLLLCSILPYTPITQATLMNVLVEIMPDSIDPLVVKFVTELYGQSVALLSVTAAITVWSGAKGIWALTRGLNVINGVENSQSYFVLRLRSCVYTIILLASIIAAMVLMVFGNSIDTIIRKAIPKSVYFMDFLMSLKFFITLFILFIFLMFLYTWLPNEKQRWYTQIPGAIFSSVIWVVFSWGFSIYAENSTGYSMYGSFTTVIILMLWLYFCMYIVLFGAMMNHFLLPANMLIWKRRHDEKKARKHKERGHNNNRANEV